MTAALSSPSAAAATMAGVHPADDTCETPRRGRPRSAEVDEAVLAATLELAGEVGVTKMSMDDLAERAKVSKATIYRRWPSKEHLVLDALRSAMSPLGDADTGSLRGDLDQYLGELIQRFQGGRMSDVLPHLIEVACHDDKIRSSLDDYVQFRRRPLRAILERAVARGELPDDLDHDVLIDAITGPITYRRLLSHQVIDTKYVNTLLTIVLAGHHRPATA
jgi:AcrR family transcriptional regulator